MEYTFLTEKFYKDYPHDKYPQMEIKEDRPYAHVTVELYNQLFCIPLRSHVDHPHAFFTNKRERCGVDYSKAETENTPHRAPQSRADSGSQIKTGRTVRPPRS